MVLPQAAHAVVEFKKIADYLLDPEHPEGAGKAAFFNDLGFRRADWKVLAEEFRQLAVRSPVIGCVESTHGRKYIVDGVINGPDGRIARVRTVWIIDTERTVPRLVTAYPRRMEANDDDT